MASKTSSLIVDGEQRQYQQSACSGNGHKILFLEHSASPTSITLWSDWLGNSFAILRHYKGPSKKKHFSPLPLTAFDQTHTPLLTSALVNVEDIPTEQLKQWKSTIRPTKELVFTRIWTFQLAYLCFADVRIVNYPPLSGRPLWMTPNLDVWFTYIY